MYSPPYMTNNVILSIIRLGLMPCRWQNSPKRDNSILSVRVASVTVSSLAIFPIFRVLLAAGDWGNYYTHSLTQVRLQFACVYVCWGVCDSLKFVSMKCNAHAGLVTQFLGQTHTHRHTALLTHTHAHAHAHTPTTLN